MPLQAPKLGPSRTSTVKNSKSYPMDSPPPSPLLNPTPLNNSQPVQPARYHSIFAGSDFWSSNPQPFLSLDVAKHTDSVVKRGFELSHNKAQEYRLSTDFNVGRDGFVRCRGRKVVRSNCATATPEKHDSTSHSPLKKILNRSPLVSLDEANRREKVRRRKAAQEVMARKTAQELQARLSEREEIKKKEMARLEQLESHLLEARKKEEARQRQEAAALASAALTAVVASPKDHLVVGPTNWIVPLISLDEAGKNETARRRREAEAGAAYTNTRKDAGGHINHLIVNTSNGSAEIRLVSLEDARMREKIRRQREETLETVKMHDLMTSRVGTGLKHVPMVTLEEARKQKSRKRTENVIPRSPGGLSVSHRRLVYPDGIDDDEKLSEGGSGSKHALGPQETARWHNLMARTNPWMWKSSEIISANAGACEYPDWL